MENLYERLLWFCKQKGVSGSRMCVELGVSKSLMSDLKSGRKKSVTAKTAQMLADYFGVSVGYLLGEENESSDILNEVDIGFYGDYKVLTEADKQTLRDMAKLMRKRREEGTMFK